MSGREVVTRDSLKRELVVNAATKPVAIAVPAVVAVAAFVLGAPWLLAVALALYLGLAGATFFDADEATRVGEAAYARVEGRNAVRELPSGLDPSVSVLLERARAEERRIRDTVSATGVAPDSVNSEVSALTAEMERIATRAQAIRSYLAEQRPDEVKRRLGELRGAPGSGADADGARARAASALEAQLRLGETMRAELGRFEAEMEHLIATLGIVHGQLVRMSVAADTHLQGAVARELADLRERVGAFADGMRDAVSQLDE
jgi:hypothetical protein